MTNSKPTKTNCPNCQSDNDTVASTINNTCPLCGRTLDKDLRGIDEATKANNLEDLWDWCCTEVYRLDNGEDVWEQINKVHQLALKEQLIEDRKLLLSIIRDYKKIEDVTNLILQSLKEKK